MPSTEPNILGPEVGVSIQYCPIFVQSELLNLDNAVSLLEQTGSRFMSQVVKTQVGNLYDFTSTTEQRAYGLCLIGKYEPGALGLPCHYVEGGLGVLEAAMVPNFLSWVFEVTDHPSEGVHVIVAPFKPSYLRL